MKPLAIWIAAAGFLLATYTLEVTLPKFAPGPAPDTETLEWERCIGSNGHPTRDGWTGRMTSCTWRGSPR